MEKLKYESMLLRTEESVRFPGLGERTKRWRNYLLSWISINVNRLQRREKSTCIGARTTAPFLSFQKGSPNFLKWESRGTGSLVWWTHASNTQDMGPPLSIGFTLFSLLITGIFIAAIQPKRTEEKEIKDTTLFSTEGSPHALWLCTYI